MAFADFNSLNDFSAIDEQLESLALGDDIEIYDFGGEGYDTLGIDENAANDLNDDTFGGDGPVGRDFDFSGQGVTSHVAPVPSAPTRDPLSFSLDTDSLLGPRSALPTQQTFPNQFQPPILHQGTAQKPRMRTLAEIEAELLAANKSPPAAIPPESTPLSKPASTPHRPRTLEEIEAEMFRSTKSTSPIEPLQAPPQPVPAQQSSRLPPMQSLPAVFQTKPPAQPPQMPPSLPIPFSHMAASNAVQFPPLGTAGPVTPQQSRNAPMDPNLQPTLGQLQGLRLAMASSFQAGQQPSEEQFNTLKRLDEAINEAEKRELLLRRKAYKLAELSSHNGIMSNGEKDFITRIQLSQLLNTLGPQGQHDPLKDDFYFTVFSAIRGARAQQAANAGQGKRKMNKMASQVQKIVDDAKKKPRATQLSLDGALGKIALRTRSAPRQMLQVSRSPSNPAVAETASPASIHQKSPSLAKNVIDSRTSKQAALGKREALLALERLYTIILDLEQNKRMQPQLNLLANTPGDLQQEHRNALQTSTAAYDQLVGELWANLQITKPLETSVPHPFISLLAPNKGKMLLPRILRHLNGQQTLTLFTLLVATFGQLDIVREAPLLDLAPETYNVVAKDLKKTRRQLESENAAFLKAIAPALMGTLAKLPLKVVTGMLSILLERNDIRLVAKSKAGIAFLTLILSRAELLNQGQAGEVPAPDETEKSQWTGVFNKLFAKLSDNLVNCFPSTRYAASLPFGAAVHLQPNLASGVDLDAEDETIWAFLATLAVCSDMAQQQNLVLEVREKVLECVTGAASKTISAEQSARKIKNVNLMLSALGLDASQITGQ